MFLSRSSSTPCYSSTCSDKSPSWKRNTSDFHKSNKNIVCLAQSKLLESASFTLNANPATILAADKHIYSEFCLLFHYITLHYTTPYNTIRYNTILATARMQGTCHSSSSCVLGKSLEKLYVFMTSTRNAPIGRIFSRNHVSNTVALQCGCGIRVVSRLTF